MDTSFPPAVMRTLMREIRKLAKSPPAGVRFLPRDDDVYSEVYAELEGPAETPFAGGRFTVKLVVDSSFPASPPRGFFTTKIFHPNVAPSGAICVNALKKDWQPNMGLSHVLKVIWCLLLVPFPESSLNDDAGRLFMESYDEYFKKAALMTRIHAIENQSSCASSGGNGGGAAASSSSSAAGPDTMPSRRADSPPKSLKVSKSSNRPSSQHGWSSKRGVQKRAATGIAASGTAKSPKRGSGDETSGGGASKRARKIGGGTCGNPTIAGGKGGGGSKLRENLSVATVGRNNAHNSNQNAGQRSPRAMKQLSKSHGSKKSNRRKSLQRL